MQKLELIGGTICLDLTNTIDPRHKDPRDEYLDTYRGLVEWAVHANALAAPAGRRLVAAAERRPAHAERVRSRAVSLREALYDLFAPGDRGGEEPHGDSLAVLNEELRLALGHSLVAPDRDGYELRFEADDQLDQMLWPIARSALDLLLSPQRERIKECGGDGCGWLFVDVSKAGRRRWCSMGSCGNRVKVQRYRERQREPGR